MLTDLQIHTATGARIDRAREWLPHIGAAMAEFEIDTPEQRAMFLAQIGHESGGLRWVVELWGPTPAQSRYEGRKDLGNVFPGDGYKFRGRGLIQITGRANYELAGLALLADLINHPELLALPPLAARSAAWYWRSRGLNDYADDILKTTKIINGGTNGLEDRKRLYTQALEVFA